MSKAELFAEMNVRLPAKDHSDSKSVEGEQPEGETTGGENKEGQVEAVKLPKKKSRKTKKNSDANKENRPVIKDKLATVIGVGKAPRPPLSQAGNMPLPLTASTPTTHEDPPLPSTQISSNNLPGKTNLLCKDLAPLPSTPNDLATLHSTSNLVGTKSVS